MPFVYYIPEQDTEAMQKPMDAERLLRCLGASGKLAGFPCAAYMVEQVREDPEPPTNSEFIDILAAFLRK